MKSRNIVAIVIIILLSIVNSQTINEIKEMQELYDQYKKGQIPELNQSLNIDPVFNIDPVNHCSIAFGSIWATY